MRIGRFSPISFGGPSWFLSRTKQQVAMTANSRAPNTRFIPVILLIFGLLPVAVGIARMAMRFGEPGPDADTIRYFAMPWAVILHVLGGGTFTVLGALQFAPGLRRTPWHRLAGRLLVLSGLVAGLSALWLTQFFPPNASDGPLLYWFRLAAGTSMLWFLAQGYIAATRRQIPLHRAHMIRAYALGIGTSTQIVLGIAYLVAFGPLQPIVGDLLLGTAWLINLAVAELAIRRGLTVRLAPRPA